MEAERRQKAQKVSILREVREVSKTDIPTAKHCTQELLLVLLGILDTGHTNDH